jgi:hypothetical protein
MYIHKLEYGMYPFWYTYTAEIGNLLSNRRRYEQWQNPKDVFVSEIQMYIVRMKGRVAS